MKARHFKKLRSKSQIYLVYLSYHLFGEPFYQTGVEVLARSYVEAAKRYYKRNHIEHNCTDECSKRFGKIKIVPKSMHFSRFAKYFD